MKKCQNLECPNTNEYGLMRLVQTQSSSGDGVGISLRLCGPCATFLGAAVSGEIEGRRLINIRAPERP